jgi:hypothetical protein
MAPAMAGQLSDYDLVSGGHFGTMFGLNGR